MFPSLSECLIHVNYGLIMHDIDGGLHKEYQQHKHSMIMQKDAGI